MKFHIIVEDKGSGKLFWESINKHFLSSKANVIVAGGVTNLARRLKENFESGMINPCDYVLIAFDNTGTLQASVQMEKLKKHVARYSLSNLLFTTYYCFEEIFLSFKYLVDWVKPRISASEISLIRFIGESIRKGQDYLLDHTGFESEFDTLILSRRLNPRTLGREQLSANLLDYITQKHIGFKITKGEIGSCWIENCCQTSVNILSNPKTKVTKFVKQCGVTANLTAKDKLSVIDTYSIFSTRGLGTLYFNELEPHIK